MVFVKAESGPPVAGDPASKFTVQYFDEKGNMTIRSGGRRTWRCNNPGSLLASPYSTGKDRRSIGTAGDGATTYAVYPDYATGHEALHVMLKGSVYSPLTLREAMKKYDIRNPTYIDSIVKITKLDPERTIQSLDANEFEMFWKAIEQVENWEVGKEEFIEKSQISGVHKKKGVIVEYLIVKSGKEIWISKVQALQYALEGRLHAVLVHLKKGGRYLRPEYGVKPFEIIFEKEKML